MILREEKKEIVFVLKRKFDLDGVKNLVYKELILVVGVLLMNGCIFLMIFCEKLEFLKGENG